MFLGREMQDFTKLTVDDFLNQVADRTPTPGGGGVTGLAGALSCAMAQMVAAYSKRKSSTPEEVAVIDSAMTALRRTDEILRALISQDAEVYEKMTAARKATFAEKRENQALETAYQDTVLRAVAVPMEMAAASSQALSAMDAFKNHASRYLLSDLAIAAVLARATARAARCTMCVNVPEVSNSERRAKFMTNIDRIILHCASHLTSIEAFVHRSLEEGE